MTGWDRAFHGHWAEGRILIFFLFADIFYNPIDCVNSQLLRGRNEYMNNAVLQRCVAKEIEQQC